MTAAKLRLADLKQNFGLIQHPLWADVLVSHMNGAEAEVSSIASLLQSAQDRDAVSVSLVSLQNHLMAALRGLHFLQKVREDNAKCADRMCMLVTSPRKQCAPQLERIASVVSRSEVPLRCLHPGAVSAGLSDSLHTLKELWSRLCLEAERRPVGDGLTSEDSSALDDAITAAEVKLRASQIAMARQVRTLFFILALGIVLVYILCRGA